jgi:hypothetical protein
VQRQAEGKVVAAHAAVFLRERQSEQAQLAHPGDDLVRELPALVVLADDRRDHLAGELLDSAAERLVLLIEREANHDLDSTPAPPARAAASQAAWHQHRAPAR